jgi:DNA-binding response OmpR family regulator
MSKILIVDDDRLIGNTLQAFLGNQNYAVEVLEAGEDALQLLNNFDFDLIILDWSLPGISGETVCLEYRKRGGQAPIIFLTGRNDISFLERGLSAGADDYLTKPFDIRELAARLQSLLRRGRGTFSADLRVHNLVLKSEINTLLVGDEKVSLRPKETALLEYFLRNPNRIFSAQQVLDAVWTSDSSATPNTVRTWMGLLRHKLAPLGHKNLIRTVAGAGYVLDSN